MGKPPLRGELCEEAAFAVRGGLQAFDGERLGRGQEEEEATGGRERDGNEREWARMDGNGREWTGMDGSRREWTGMDGNGREWTGKDGS